MSAPVPMRLDVQRSAQQGLAWYSPIIPSWASSLSHRLLRCRPTAPRTSCMCGQRASFNAASVAHEAIGSVDAYIQRRGVDPSLVVVGAWSEDRSERRVEVLVVQHQPRNSALEFVNFAVRRAQLLAKRQRCANSSRVATRTALDNSGSILSNARAMATPPTMPETSAIVRRRAGLSALAAQGRPRFIQ